MKTQRTIAAATAIAFALAGCATESADIAASYVPAAPVRFRQLPPLALDIVDVQAKITEASAKQDTAAGNDVGLVVVSAILFCAGAVLCRRQGRAGSGIGAAEGFARNHDQDVQSQGLRGSVMNRLVAELNAYERTEDRLAYRSACLVSDAAGIAQDVIRGDECRREAYIEDVYCNERLCRNLLRDLLDDLQARHQPVRDHQAQLAGLGYRHCQRRGGVTMKDYKISACPTPTCASTVSTASGLPRGYFDRKPWYHVSDDAIVVLGRSGGS